MLFSCSCGAMLTENGLHHLLLKGRKEMKPGERTQRLILRTEGRGAPTQLVPEWELQSAHCQPTPAIRRESFTWSSKWYSPVSASRQSAKGVYKDPSSSVFRMSILYN